VDAGFLLQVDDPWPANASPTPDEAPVTNPNIAYLQGIRAAVLRRLATAVTAG